MQLHARVKPWGGEPRVVRVTTRSDRPSTDSVFLSGGALLVMGATPAGDVVVLPDALSYLSDGDVIRLVPQMGEVNVLYRRTSPHNSVLLTERCNSRCLMCSQPPKAGDDSYLVDVWLQAVRLMDPETPELGISGGEPALLGERLLELLRTCRQQLPKTALHMLSNGRLFNYLSFAREVAKVGCEDLMVGIPVYSDLSCRHDFVVQAQGAFDQTLRGIINLKRCGVGVELRVVLHQETVGRLPQLARFITRNLPFVDHVALMGLELMGFAKTNLDALWIEPLEYQPKLCGAVEELARARMNVSIYNHQLCILDRSLWPYARKSISDWKTDYVEECSRCAERERCGGFFASASLRRPAHIKALQGEAGAA